MCNKCGNNNCCCVKTVSKTGPRGLKGNDGKPGKDGNDATITVKDAQTHVVLNVKELRFNDANAVVTELSPGVAEIKLVPAATVWTDIQNLNQYVAGSESFRPQYTIEGNKITFRGLLYVPLESAGSPVNVSNGNSYLAVSSVTLDESRMSIITNANSNNGTPQGRFFTPNVVANPNLPVGATPIARDIIFNNVQAFRRYSSGRVANYRSVVDLRIGSTTTALQNSGNPGVGCIMIFAPFNSEYDGAGTAPLGNDPLGLLISRATGGVAAVDYIASLDNAPFSVPASAANNPFDVNAHHIQSLGGFIINLEGLSGYLN